MDFFGIGPLEVLVVLLLAFIIFGPEKLLEVSRSAGKFIRELNRKASSFSNRIDDEPDQRKVQDSQNERDKAKPE